MEQKCTTLVWIWGDEHDIIVDNKSATGNNKNTLFLLNNKYGPKKVVGAILAAMLIWAAEHVLAKVEMKLSG